MDDNIPVEEDIDTAVMWLRLHLSIGMLGMRSKHLRLWISAAKQEGHPNPGNYKNFVAVIQAAYRGG